MGAFHASLKSRSVRASAVTPREAPATDGYGGAIGFAWHAPGSAGTWADIRTWVGFAVPVIGVVVALVRLDLQRRQLPGQHKVIQEEVERDKRRDALISGQLRELEQRALTFERQQADAIGLRPSTFGIRVRPGWTVSPAAAGEPRSGGAGLDRNK